MSQRCRFLEIEEEAATGVAAEVVPMAGCLSTAAFQRYPFQETEEEAAMGVAAETHYGEERTAVVPVVAHMVEACQTELYILEVAVVGPEALWAMFGIPG